MDSQSTAIMQPDPGIFDAIEAQAVEAQKMARTFGTVLTVATVFLIASEIGVVAYLFWLQQQTRHSTLFMMVGSPLMALIPLGILVALRSRITRMPEQIRRGAEVVRSTQPVRQRLNIYARANGETQSWFVDIQDPRTPLDAPPLYTLTLLGRFSQQSAAVAGVTEGLVYAKPGEPVVVQTNKSVLIGLRKGEKPAKQRPGKLEPGKIIVK